MSPSLQFADAAIESQAAFRAIMEAMSRPGTRRAVPPPASIPRPLSAAAAAIARALFDHETPVWLDPATAASGEVVPWLRFATGARIVAEPGEAAFALIGDPLALPPFAAFALGTDEYPDRSTTLVIEVARFATDDGALVLSGPGLAAPQKFGAAPLPADFAERLAGNRALFPRGVDLLFACCEEVIALPRSVQAIAGGL